MKFADGLAVFGAVMGEDMIGTPASIARAASVGAGGAVRVSRASRDLEGSGGEGVKGATKTDIDL